MRGRAIYWRIQAFGGNLLVWLLMTALLFGCKDKAEEVGSEQKKKDVAGKEQKQEADATGARTIEFTLHAAKAPEPAQKYQLLPKAAEQIDADAAPLYEKALQALPKNFQTEQITQWLKTTPEKLPLKQVQSTLEQFNPSMELLKQAAKCKQCDWPNWDYGTWSQNTRGYRTLAFFLDIQARVQIAQGQYDKAIGTVQTGFAMGRHLGEGPNLPQGLVGIAICGRMFWPLEQFVQGANAPNLYRALRDLPKPFIDLTELAEFEDQDYRDRVHLLMNRLDRNVAALRGIEAIRLYAAAHNGKFPNELSDITQASVSDDPDMQKLIIYRRSGSKAFLEAPTAQGTADKYTFRYELSLKK
ncbi:MAG: hypothetical protein ACYS80_22685 [Planctomycetota bacterium]|jgi:hypothetical protein